MFVGLFELRDVEIAAVAAKVPPAQARVVPGVKKCDERQEN